MREGGRTRKAEESFVRTLVNFGTMPPKEISETQTIGAAKVLINSTECSSNQLTKPVTLEAGHKTRLQTVKSNFAVCSDKSYKISKSYKSLKSYKS